MWALTAYGGSKEKKVNKFNLKKYRTHTHTHTHTHTLRHA